MSKSREKRQKRIQNMVRLGRKYKAFRYFLIALLAVVIFCDHLVHNTTRKFKICALSVISACVLCLVLFQIFGTRGEEAGASYKGSFRADNRPTLEQNASADASNTSDTSIAEDISFDMKQIKEKPVEIAEVSCTINETEHFIQTESPLDLTDGAVKVQEMTVATAVQNENKHSNVVSEVLKTGGIDQVNITEKENAFARERVMAAGAKIVNKVLKTGITDSAEEESDETEDSEEEGTDEKNSEKETASINRITTSLNGKEDREKIETEFQEEGLFVSVSYNEADVCRIGYEEAPEITLELENIGNTELEGFSFASNYFDLIQPMEEDRLNPGEKQQIQIALIPEMEVGIYEDDIEIKSEGMKKPVVLTISQEVRREKTELTVSALSIEVMLGGEIPVIKKEDYIVKGLREPDTIDCIEGLEDTTYLLDTTDEIGTGESESLELKAEDYDVTFIPGKITVVPRIPDETYYCVSGKGYSNDFFTGDIIITPMGVDGFNQIKTPDMEEYESELVIREDGTNRPVELQFSNGTVESEPYTYYYNRDTAAPVISVSDSEKYGMVSGNLICTRGTLAVNVSDYAADVSENATEDASTDDVQTLSGNTARGDASWNGSGVSRIQYAYADQEYSVPVENGKAYLNFTDQFYGQLFIRCQDEAGNWSEPLELSVINEVGTPVVTFMKTAKGAMITLLESGNIVSGIREYHCFVNGTELLPDDYAITNQVKLNDDYILDSGLALEYALAENEDVIRFMAEDNAGNMVDETCNLSMLQVVSSYNGMETVSVKLPTKLDFAIEPQGLLPCGQILADNLELVNYSNVPVEVQITDAYYEFDDPENCEAMDAPVYRGKGGQKHAYLYLSRAEILDKNGMPVLNQKKTAESVSENEGSVSGNQSEVLLEDVCYKYKEFTDDYSGSDINQLKLSQVPRADETKDILLSDQHRQEPVSIYLAPAAYDENGNLIAPTVDGTAVYRFFGSLNSDPRVKWYSGNIKVHVSYKVVPIRF